MKTLISVLVVLCVAGVSSLAYSQSQPSAELVTLSNYDLTAPAVWIECPGVQGEQAYTGFGERFTLTGGSGYLDSISIHFDSVSGDILRIGVFTDVLRENARGTFHLADYSFTGLIASFELDLSPLMPLRDFWVTIATDHIAIPKDFHIGVGANPLNAGGDEYTSMFRLMGEKHVGQEATIDSRSDILLTQDFLNFTTDVFDGFFTSAGRPLGINFHIDAIVDETPSAVKLADTRSFAVYPNPIQVNGELHVLGASSIKSLKLYDVLGNEAAAWQCNNESATVTIPAVASGVYTLLVSDALGTHTQKLVVR